MKTSSIALGALAVGVAAFVLARKKNGVSGIGATQYKEVRAKLLDAWYRNSSLYGNPSYWVTLETEDGRIIHGFTSPNAALGYGIKNSENYQFQTWVYTEGKRGKAFHYTR